MRYLGIIEYDRRPPKSWAKKDMSYFADRLARKAKNVTAGAVSTYRSRGWFVVQVDSATTADRARELLRLAMHGSEPAQQQVKILSNRENLLRWSAPSRRDVLDDLHATHEDDPDEVDFTIRGTKVSDDPMSAIFMGMGPAGITYEVNTTIPFEVGSVRADRQGFANLGVITVEMTSPKPRDLIHLARDIAVAFAREHDVVFELHNPSRGTESRRRRFVDENPKSQSFGKNKMGYPTVWAFEVPYSTMRRLPPEKRALFEFGSRGARWPASKVKTFLGLDRATPLRENGPQAGDDALPEGFEGFGFSDAESGESTGPSPAYAAATALKHGDVFHLGGAASKPFRVLGGKGTRKTLVREGSAGRKTFELVMHDYEADHFSVYEIRGGSGERVSDKAITTGALTVWSG